MEAAVDELAPLNGSTVVIPSMNVGEEPATRNTSRRRRIVAAGVCIATLTFFGCSFLLKNRSSTPTTASVASMVSTTSFEAPFDNDYQIPSADWNDFTDVESESLTPFELCVGGFVQLKFDIFNYDAYNTYFDESSTLTLAQTGTYTGPDGIKEYVYFADENSSYIQAKREYVKDTLPTGFDPKTNICKFTTYFIQGTDFEPVLTSGNTLNYGAITHTYYSAVTNKVPVVQVYYTEPFLEAFFTQLQTRQVNDFVCDVLLGPGCMAELGDQAERGLTKHKCVKRLSRLPLSQGEDLWIDGNSKGCRYLHAEFALKNTFHCAHVSLIPAEDPKGNTKCQTSAYLSPDKFFTQTEIDRLYEICGTQTALGLDQNTCFHEIKRHHPSSKKSKKSSEKSSKKSSKKDKKTKEMGRRQ